MAAAQGLEYHLTQATTERDSFCGELRTIIEVKEELQAQHKQTPADLAEIQKTNVNTAQP